VSDLRQNGEGRPVIVCHRPARDPNNTPPSRRTHANVYALDNPSNHLPLEVPAAESLPPSSGNMIGAGHTAVESLAVPGIPHERPNAACRPILVQSIKTALRGWINE
jgi:hypothetical protein